MCRSGNAKHYSFTTVWIIVAAFLAGGTNYAKTVTESPLLHQHATKTIEETAEAVLAINSACDKILKGDFVVAQRIVKESPISDSEDLRQLRKVLDEYVSIEARRRASQEKHYQTQMVELKKLYGESLSEDYDINNINKVFSVVTQILEYADKEQKQALLKDPLLILTIQKAKAKAAAFAAKGKWLDAYAICYEKLKEIYKNEEAYSDCSKPLLEMADISAFLEDNPCETIEKRCAGIKKQIFINAIDFLDSSYVNIIDYHQMAIEGVNRCKLLAAVMSNSDLGNRYKITNAQFVAWSETLGTIVDELNQSPSDISKEKFTNVFEEVLALNDSSAGGIGLPTALLIAQFAQGALSALDPYTVIYWPSQVQDFQKVMKSQFSGIGIRFSKKEGVTKIVKVLPNTPAYRSGLEAGDIISAVDGVEIETMSANCVVKRIVGPEGTKVTLTVRQPSEDETSDITVDRTRITIPSVHGWQLNETGEWRYIIDSRNKIAYVRISGFNSRTADDFERVIDHLDKNELRGLLLDLRSNSGGLLLAAVEIADKFISEGLIARIQPRIGIATYISAHKEKTHPDYPIVVLINRFTVSAAEILAGVLQDRKYNRATLVGEATYGKGSVQSITNYCGHGAQLKYTMGYYHLPSGQRIESREIIEKTGRKDWGVSPDVRVEPLRDELQKIANLQNANESVVTIGQENARSSVKRYSSQETIDADPQLAIGLLVLKSKLIQSGCESVLN